MSDFERERAKKRPSPLSPLIGFLVFLAVSGFSWVTAPAVITFMATSDVKFGSFGWQILPITFPEEWPFIVSHLLVAGAMFLFIFTLSLILLFLIMKPPRTEEDIDIRNIRAEREKKRRRRRRRR